eukprot:1691745-Prymnesium_polylepis.1
MRTSVAPEPHFSVDDERIALLIEPGGWWRPISYWRATYEPPPKKKKTKKKEPPKKTAAQLEKEKQKTLRRLGWIVDKVAEKIWVALLEVLPEISSDFLGDACAVAREQQASASEADAEFFNCFARLTNCLAAMDATMRFETTARLSEAGPLLARKDGSCSDVARSFAGHDGARPSGLRHICSQDAGGALDAARQHLKPGERDGRRSQLQL